MKKLVKPPKPGFVRVHIPAKNRTLQIREYRARNKKFMNDMGMILMQDPELPPLAPPPVKTVPQPEGNPTKAATHGS